MMSKKYATPSENSIVWGYATPNVVEHPYHDAPSPSKFNPILLVTFSTYSFLIPFSSIIAAAAEAAFLRKLAREAHPQPWVGHDNLGSLASAEHVRRICKGTLVPKPIGHLASKEKVPECPRYSHHPAHKEHILVDGRCHLAVCRIFTNGLEPKKQRLLIPPNWHS